jgi:hypothetical protein
MPSRRRHTTLLAAVLSTRSPVAAAALLGRWWVLLSAVATLVATGMSATVLFTISIHTSFLTADFATRTWLCWWLS